jgi:hypothetical protein
MTRRWMGSITFAKAGVHAPQAQPLDFDGTLRTRRGVENDDFLVTRAVMDSVD